MAYTYNLPNKRGKPHEYGTIHNSVILIGANGSGKSKLGAWIEEHDFDGVHRISGQRYLSFSEIIPLKRFATAADDVFYGSETGTSYKHEKMKRWGYGEDRGLTTHQLNDYNDVLGALFALYHNENEKYVALCRDAEALGSKAPCAPNTVIDRLETIWSKVLPERALVYEDSTLYATFSSDEKKKQYSATQMSDGERSVLYLTAQVLCVPANKTIVIDEPELHLHGSIMTRLWNALERERPDCLFIYITHDTQFAAEHTFSDKFWVKDYDGENWTLQKLEDDLPEELLLDILGSRKNVLFVEGERNSLDTALYTELYPNYYIVPCGGCSQVIERTKAFRKNLTLHDCVVYGIIDRDYRSEHEIDALKKDFIYTLNVAEIENLFIVEELVRIIARHMEKDADSVFANVKKYVIEDRFSKEINKQICESVVAKIKYILACAEISKKNDSEAKASLQAVLNSINFDAIRGEQEASFQAVLRDADYKEVLKLFNEKSIAKSIGHFISIVNDRYLETVIALMQSSKHDEIVAAIRPYLPVEIPCED